MSKQTFDRIKVWSRTRGISQQKVATNNWIVTVDLLKGQHELFKSLKISGYVLNKIEELTEYAEAMRVGDMNEAVDAICDSTIFDMTELDKMGFDNEPCIDEALKVVESRTGSWDDKLGKFVKDTSPEAKARWYKHDYVNRCTLKEDSTGSLFND